MSKSFLLVVCLAFLIAFSGCNKDDAINDSNELEAPFLHGLTGWGNPTTSVQLRWYNVSGAIRYNIYRSSSESGPFNRIGSATGQLVEYVLVQPNGREFTIRVQYLDRQPLSGRNVYRITAVYSEGESAPSNTISTTIFR